MTPGEAQRLIAYAVDLGLSTIIETAEIEGAIVRVWLTAGTWLTLSADTPAVRYLVAHVVEITE